MEWHHEGNDGPQGSCEQAVADAHGHDGEVGVDVTEAEDAVTDQGDDDSHEDEQDVSADAVDDVADDGGDESGHQVHQACWKLDHLA